MSRTKRYTGPRRAPLAKGQHSYWSARARAVRSNAIEAGADKLTATQIARRWYRNNAPKLVASLSAVL